MPQRASTRVVHPCPLCPPPSARKGLGVLVVWIMGGKKRESRNTIQTRTRLSFHYTLIPFVGAMPGALGTLVWQR
jgi:hypothetical protein